MHAGDFSQAGDDLLQVLEVFNVNYHVNVGLAVGGADFDVAYVGVVVADDGGHLLEHAGAIIVKQRDFYRISGSCLGIARPLHGDAPLRFVHQVGNVGTVPGVYRHAFAAGHIADNVLTANGIAAARAVHQQVVMAFYLDGIVIAAKNAAYHAGYRALLFLVGFAGLLRGSGSQFGQHLARGKLAIADAGQEVISPPQAVVRGHAVKILLLDVFERHPVFARLFFDQFATDFDGALALMHVEPVLDLVARP